METPKHRVPLAQNSTHAHCDKMGDVGMDGASPPLPPPSPPPDRGNFRVLIAGGSVTGLALALMLDQAGVDFAVLEARDAIAPQVGAGVALHANGFRIADQLGLYDDLVRASAGAGRTPLDYSNNWWPDGSLHSRQDGFSALFRQATGYPMLVLDRQQLLRILHDKNSQRHAKVHTGARIQSVSQDRDGVSVATADGRVFRGHMLVGADGVHSTVRQEMWRIGRETAPGSFTGDEINDIKCSWMTMFGIATMPEGSIEPGGVNTTFRHRSSLGIMAGGDRRCYFFMNQALPRELRGKDIPRFTDEDCERMARERGEEVIQRDVKFKHLYEARTRAVLVPLQEYVMDKWYFGRILTIGDSAHKLHPVTGQGAMLAFEDAATLVNLLTAGLAQSPSGCLGQGELDAVFSQTQQRQKARSEKLVAESFMAQKMQAWHSPLFKLAATHIMPSLGFDVVLNLFLEGARHATSLKGPHFRAPPRRGPALVGFDDEHPEPQSALRSAVMSMVFLMLWALSMCSVLRWWWPSSGQESTNAEQFQLSSCLFRLNTTGPLALILAEGWRRSNKIWPTYWPVVWGLMADILGFETIIPFYCFLNTLQYSSRGRMQYVITHRVMPPAAAKYAFPIEGLLYTLPAVLALSLFQHRGELGVAGALIRYVLDLPLAAIVAVFTLAASLLSSESDEILSTRYLRYLEGGYGGLVGVLASCHLWFAGWSPEVLMADTPTAAAYTALLVWLVFVVSEVSHYRDLRGRAGLLMAAVPILFLCVGPGAAALSVWWWRERTISQETRGGVAVEPAFERKKP